MSANANGTPTPLGIPTLNPEQDKLKADGVNEIVESIDSKIQQRLSAPTSALDGEVIKWSQSGDAYIPAYVKPSELAQDGATDKQVLVWSSSAGKWVPNSIELAYAESGSTSDIAIGTTAVTVATLPSLTFDGATKVRIICSAPYIGAPPASGAYTQALLVDGSSTFKILGLVLNNANSNLYVPMSLSYEFTPSAGSHTYKFAAVTSAGSGLIGSNTAGNYAPPFIRAERVI